MVFSERPSNKESTKGAWYTWKMTCSSDTPKKFTTGVALGVLGPGKKNKNTPKIGTSGKFRGFRWSDDRPCKGDFFMFWVDFFDSQPSDLNKAGGKKLEDLTEPCKKHSQTPLFLRRSQ